MKVQVKDKQGIDEAGNKYPAPGIEDGTHECELKWQVFSWLSGGDWKDFDVNKYGDPKAFNMQTRQVWVLAEQEKEDDNKHITAEDINKPKSTFISRLTGLKYNEQSTRIAELQSRVAELEGVLKEIEKTCKLIVTNKYIATPYPISKVYKLATNALKNQQP